MSDAVAIAPDLAFRQQVADSLQHASRSMPQAEQIAARELMSTFDAQLNKAGEGEVPAETKQDIVRKVVNSYVETNGALDATKEGEAEASNLLLQHVLASTFDTKGADYAELEKSLIKATGAGGKAAVEAGKTAKVEAAERMSLNNTYNLLSAESPLRPVALLALVQLLGEADDLAALPLTPATLNTALSLWAVSDADKVSFLTDAAAVYEPAGDLEHALTLSILALERSINPKTAEHALALAIAIPDRFDLDDLLKVQGVRDALTGHAAELVALFTTVDELEAVAEASKWVAANESYVSGLGVQGLDAEEVVRKVRLIALTTLAARSSTKELAYADLASTLGVKEDEVEAWVIDAIRANLLQGRLSQPLAVVRVISVSSRATRRFGSSEWQLLERRLGEWKAAVADARASIADAEKLAADGPITNNRRAQPRRQQQQGEEQEEAQ